MTKQRIKFIVNPKSGGGNKEIVLPAIQKHLDTTKYNFDISFTEFAGHAKALSSKAIKDGYDTVVAVGGDGSVNEVASGIIGTNANLGILPLGSGNGFAMHTGIGRNLVKAIKILNTGKVVRVDTCMVNKEPFINLCGVGFDGLVATAFKNKTKRGFISYLQLSLGKAFSAGFHYVNLNIDGEQTFDGEIFLLEMANAPMFGYNFEIVPTANLTSGHLDVLLVRKANKLRIAALAPRLLFSNFHKGGRLVKTYNAKKVEVEMQSPVPMHYDGEGFVQRNKTIVCEIVPKSLNVILPKNGKY